MAYYRASTCKALGGGGVITVSNLDQLSDAGLVAKAIFGSNLAPAVTALTVEGMALSNALYAVAATAAWASNSAMLGPEPYDDAAVVAQAGYGSNAATSLSNQVYGPVTTALANLAAADVTLSNAVFAAQATAVAATSALSNAVFGAVSTSMASLTAADAALSNALYTAQAATEMKTVALSNQLHDVITVTLAGLAATDASLAAADASLSNVIFPGLTALGAQASYASNVTWVTSNVIFDDVIPHLDAVDVTATWASNQIVTGGGGGGTAAPSGWRVTSNAAAYTACNVGVKTSQPAYDLSVVGSTGTSRLVITRTMEGVPPPDDTTFADALAYSSNTSTWASNNTGGGGGTPNPDGTWASNAIPALVASAAYSSNAVALINSEGFADGAEYLALVDLAEYSSNAVAAIVPYDDTAVVAKAVYSSNAVAAIVPYNDTAVVAKATYASNAAVWASNAADAAMLQVFAVEGTADYASNALPAINARAVFGSNLSSTVTANGAAITAVQAQASYASNALPAIDARAAFGSNLSTTVTANGAAITTVQAQASYASNALPAIDARAAFGSNLGSTVTANGAAITAVTAQATAASNAAYFSSNALPAIDARAAFGSNLSTTVTANTSAITTVTAQAAFGSNTSVSACNIAVAASNQAFTAGGSSSAGWTLINTVTAGNGAAAVTFSNMGTTYNNYKLVFNSAMALTTDTSLHLQASANNGSTWLSTGYATGISRRQLNTGTISFSACNNSYVLAYVATNAGYPNCSGDVTLYGLNYSSPGGPLAMQMTGHSSWQASAGYTVIGDVGGLGPSGVNAIKAYWSTGNHFTGVYSLYGLKS